MAQTHATDTDGFLARHHFWIRRLHSLSGVLPLGVFLCFHLSANASILTGHYDDGVSMIHMLADLGVLIPMEIAFIFVPLAFHIGLGLWIAQTARMNGAVYRYPENRRYTLQRITAWIGTAFILYHLWHMHWLGEPFNGARFDPENASASATRAIQASWIISVVYAIGVACTVYHFANGLWTFLITWGVTIGARSQRAASAVCAFIGIVVGVLGLASVAGFTFRDAERPPAAESGHASAAGSHADAP